MPLSYVPALNSSQVGVTLLLGENRQAFREDDEWEKMQAELSIRRAPGCPSEFPECYPPMLNDAEGVR